MLVRDSVDEDGQPAIEVCMLRRNLNAEFVAGAYVFPGGSVDPGDRGAEVEVFCSGRSDAEASALLGVDSGGLSFWIAALRECFEEAGVLLAYPRDTSSDAGSSTMLDTSDPVVAARFAAYRDGVNAGTTRFVDVCQAENLILATETVHYVSHWITPSLAPKRFDTRFFVTAAPPGQVAVHDDGETIATIWVRPDDALARSEAGQLELMPPTIANLQYLGQFDDTEALLKAAAAITEVPTVEPVVLIEDGGFRVLHPGDPGYDDALAKERSA